MNKISLCMIVKNEEANLQKCLGAIENFVDEIIIVDTGSTDKTVEIASQYTDKIYNYVWNNDFGMARNYSISKASNEYILVLDCDEFVEEFNRQEIDRLIKKNPKKVGRLLRINEYSRMGVPYKYNERVNRLFSKDCYKYEGIIHEQVVAITDIEEDTYNIPLTITHSGYEGDVNIRKKKTERNIKLLKTALLETPDDPYIIYQLGKSYYMEEDYKKASEYFGQALYYDLDIRLEYVQDMVESYGYSLINSEQYEQALQLVNVYDEFSHSADFIFMIALVLMNNGRFQEAVGEFLKATKIKDVKMEGVNNFLAFYNIGVIYEALGDLKNARKYYKMCGEYEKAKQQINSLL